MSGLVIAIDGPSASGKSTVSRQVAKRLNFIHVDSGALYRGLTWYFLSHKVNAADGATVSAALRQMRMDFMIEDSAINFSIDGVAPGAALRSEAVNNNVSPIAALPAVREGIARQLRRMPSFGDLVMEGRDIGTVVFPDARFKFYLDATPEERARRRYLEMLNGKKDACGAAITYDEILRSILKRDGIDSSRALAPLKMAPKAVAIQSTKMSFAEVVDFIVLNVQSSQFTV